MSAYTDARVKLHEPCKGSDIITWQDAIEAAEEEIRKCERRILRLRNAIGIARKMIKAGEPFDEPMQSSGKKQ